MKEPRKNPGTYRTSHGATASPRMARLYVWFQDNRIGISDWSTDDGVDACADRLRAAAEWLEKFMAQPRKPTEPTQEELEALQRDLERIRGRGTKSRVKADKIDPRGGNW